ncbi:MAG: hypothetical protein ACKVQJ_04315 [Pyrinomonadaceae bacterium]
MNVQKGQTMEYTVGYDFDDSDIDAFLYEPGSLKFVRKEDLVLIREAENCSP